jgi:hypothetical protein
MSEISRNTTLTDSEKSKEQLLDELPEPGKGTAFTVILPAF